MILNKTYIILVCISMCLLLAEKFLAYLLTDGRWKSNALDLFKNNGLYIKNDTGRRKVPQDVDGGQECSAKTLVTCKIDDSLFGCSNCREILSECVHFETDILDENNHITIPKNSPGEGYCLPLNDNRNRRKCTARNGGRWILSRNEDKNSYAFVCMCSNENFFIKRTLLSDCDSFVGCRNGKLISDWSTFEKMACDCDTNYELLPGTTNFPPQCTRKNIFRYNKDTLEFKPLSPEYISPKYLELLDGGDVFLPNPCHFDVVTRKYNAGIGKIVLDPDLQIAYCEATDSRYIEIITSDDYLLNNQGRFSNGVAMITNKGAHERQYGDDVVYEVHRKPKQNEDVPLEGVRMLYSDFIFYLPYFEENSGNMGDKNGILYNHVPNRDDRYGDIPKVFVFRAVKPKQIKLKIANTLSWVPAFMATGAFDTNYRSYNGVLPFKHFSLLPPEQIHIIYPNIPAKCVRSLLKEASLQNGLNKPNIFAEQFSRDYAFPIFTSRNEINPYSILFTGLFVTYKDGNDFYSKPLSPGRVDLCTKYRKHYDSEWTSIAKNPTFKNHPCPAILSLAAHNDAHLFTENAFNYERSAIGVPTQRAGQYRFEPNTGTVIFAEKY